MRRPRWLSRRFVLCALPVAALAGVFAARGGSNSGKKPGRDSAVLKLLPRGPHVLVEIADSPRATLILEGPVDVSRAEGGVPMFRGILGQAGEPLRVILEADRVRLGDVSDPGPLEIRPSPGDTSGGWHIALDVEGSGGPRRFRGALVVSGHEGSLRFASKLSIEEYLAAVVGSEMAASAVPIEALKAQAVAARTYALFALLSSESRGREVRFAAGATFQAYGGVEKEHPRAIEAVQATSGEVLTYRGGLFRAYFHSTCGGRTADAARVFGEPSIEPLAGAACGACGGARFAAWESKWSAAEIEEALHSWAAQKGIALGAVENIDVSETDADGRARYVRVRHSGGSFEILASRLRALLAENTAAQIRSASFAVTKQDGVYRFDGRGWGHGVGLCQTGAAKKGETESYREILSDYFPGSEMERAY